MISTVLWWKKMASIAIPRFISYSTSFHSTMQEQCIQNFMTTQSLQNNSKLFEQQIQSLVSDTVSIQFSPSQMLILLNTFRLNNSILPSKKLYYASVIVSKWNGLQTENNAPTELSFLFAALLANDSIHEIQIFLKILFKLTVQCGSLHSDKLFQSLRQEYNILIPSRYFFSIFYSSSFATISHLCLHQLSYFEYDTMILLTLLEFFSSKHTSNKHLQHIWKYYYSYWKQK